MLPLRRLARFRYGDALASSTREDGEFPVLGSGGRTGWHSHANAIGPLIVVGRKGSFGSVHWECGDCFVIDTAYAIDQVRADVNLRWLYYAIHAVDLRGVSQDVGVPGLPREAAYGVMIPFVRLEGQCEIANFLDAETSILDDVKNRRTRQLATLDELAQSEIDAAIAQVGSLSHIRLGYLAAVQTGVTVDASRRPGRDAATFPYLRVANVQVGRLDLSLVAEITVPRAAASLSTLRYGDVLMTEGGDLDKLGRGTVWRDEITPCLHQNHVFAVRPDKQKLVPDYLALVTRSSQARDYFERTGNRTTNLASTSSSKIRDFRIPLPDVDTQRKVVDQVEERLRLIAEFRDRLTHQLALLAERRQALITAAVTGQIDVSTARGVEV